MKEEREKQMVMDKDTEIEIAGKKYRLCFPIRCIFEAEKELGESLLVTIGKISKGIELREAYILLKWAIVGGGTALKEPEMEKLFTTMIAENKFSETMGNVFGAIVKSGVIGEPKKIAAAMEAKRKA